MNLSNRWRILAVDDEDIILDLYSDTLTPSEKLQEQEIKLQNLASKLFGKATHVYSFPLFDLVSCSQGDDALELVTEAVKENNPFAVVFLDIRMPPGPNGVWTAEEIRKVDPNIEIVIVTAYSDIRPEEIARRVLPPHKLLYVQKPFLPQEILQFASALGAKWHTEREFKRMQEELEIKVRERTSELEEAYSQLKKEIAGREKMEKEIMKIEKLESLGILAGGIAHDFNNILSAIMGNINLAKNALLPDDKIYKRLEKADRACQRAKALTYQLLTFSKGGMPLKKTASITEIIEETAGFILTGSAVKFENHLNNEIWPVELDVNQFSQVINNLFINSIQAMPEGGIITIKSENVIIKEEDKLPITGKYVKIIFHDNGPGIPEEHLGKIFDPFFTTKTGGNGLGLATTYSIIKRHDGYIAVDSGKDRGTTFYIYLPGSENKISYKTSYNKIIKGSGRILLMDDDVAVMEMAGDMLGLIGYEVAFSSNGNEAIDCYKKSIKEGKPFSAVIMDLTVPGNMGGKETIKKLLEINPSVKAIVSSGYSNDPVMANFKEYGFSGFIIKPYNIYEMSQVIAEVMGER